MNKHIPSIFIALFIVGTVHITDAEPVISSVDGILKHDNVLTVTGKGFSAKENAKPLLYWSADEGLLPSSRGRKTAWDTTFTGSIVTTATPGATVAPGSNSALRADMSEGEILAGVFFTSDDLYVWRKRQDAFDLNEDYARRTGITLSTKSILVKDIAVGQWVRGATSNATAKIISLTEEASQDRVWIFYEKSSGTINNPTPTDFIDNETVEFFEDDSNIFDTPVASATAFWGLLRTFNYKVIRFWGNQNNVYMVTGPATSSGSPDISGRLLVEYTESSVFWGGNWDNTIDNKPNQWVIEEFQYRTSTLDNADGVLKFRSDGIEAWSNRSFKFIDSTYPTKYYRLYQNQVSNGAYPGSYEYFDSLYVDDTWHRVIICESPVYSNCKDNEVQIPETWTDTSITFRAKTSMFPSNDNLYLYVADENGIVNQEGKRLCPTCPDKPKINSIQ